MSKRVIVTRIGAIGDALIVTPLYRAFHEAGWHVTANVNKTGRQVLDNNPHIDTFLMHDESIPPDHRLEAHWAKIFPKYDKAVNLCESIEGQLSRIEGHPSFYWSKAKRHAECNKNFYDHTMALGGFPEQTGTRPEFYPTREERQWAKDWLSRFRREGKYVLLWSLSGSSFHKTYPHFEGVLTEFLARHPEAVCVTVGDSYCVMLEFKHPQMVNKAGLWTIRETLTMTRYVDAVVGTDTGILHGAACWPTPKLLLTSANTEENLSKYWLNTVTLAAGVPCQPCHRLIYSLRACPINETWQSPICMADLAPERVLEAMETMYQTWAVTRQRHLQGVG